jgi:aminopeptidase N
MDFFQKVPSQMGGNYGLYIYLDDILALDAFFPIIPVYNHEGWNVENPPRNADMIFADASFFEFRVSAPSDLVLVASGVQVNSEEKNGRQEVTFVAGPQRDFYLAASPRFISESLNVGGTLVTSYFPEEYPEMGALVLNTAVQALIIFSEEYGVYPYSELDLVSTPMQAGGMEYSGAAAMALYLYEPDITFGGMPGSAFLESATAHEVAHQWFFNQVMNDQIEEPWLDEGFAQYLTNVYFRGAYGEKASLSYRDSWKTRWARTDFAEIPIGLPADAYEPEQYSPIIYGRAPIFIAELEKLMGTVTFNEFLRDYLETYRWQEVGTRDFLEFAELACDCELDDLVAQYGVVQ